MADREDARRGERARQFLESDVWIEAWAVFRERLLFLMETCDSSNVAKIQEVKQMLTAGQKAKAHLEAIMSDGKVAAESIKLEEAQKRWFNR